MINLVMIMQNEFDKEIKYKLYRSVKEILHPTISKKNISNYRIVIKEDIFPIRVFYPKKVTGINKVIIYIHGNGKVTNCSGKYSDICKKIALETNHLLIAIEYQIEKKLLEKTYQKIAKTTKYLYEELTENGINTKDITLMGDSTGCNMIAGINYLSKEKNKIKKEVLFYPILSLKYFDVSKYKSLEENKEFNSHLIESLQGYFSKIVSKEDLNKDILTPLKVNQENTPKTLILVGKVDSLKEEAEEYYNLLKPQKRKYVEIPFCAHGFLKSMDKELETEIFEKLNNFLQ